MFLHVFTNCQVKIKREAFWGEGVEAFFSKMLQSFNALSNDFQFVVEVIMDLLVS